MSEPGGDSENVALVRRGFDAFSRGALEESLSIIHEDIEWHVAFPVPDLPIGKDVFHGHEEVRQLWVTLRGGFEVFDATLEEVVAERGDVVVARIHWVARGAASGVELDRTVFYVLDIEKGLLRRLRPFDEEADALHAAGF